MDNVFFTIWTHSIHECDEYLLNTWFLNQLHCTQTHRCTCSTTHRWVVLQVWHNYIFSSHTREIHTYVGDCVRLCNPTKSRCISDTPPARSRQPRSRVSSTSERYECILPTAGLSLPELLQQEQLKKPCSTQTRGCVCPEACCTEPASMEIAQ